MKFTKTLAIGTQVVLNDKAAAVVYKVVAKHTSLNAYSLAYTNLAGRVVGSSVWIDISAIQLATTEQIDCFERQQEADRRRLANAIESFNTSEA